MVATGLPTRTLGRTGMEVTQLGYGAMELRGAPRGRELTAEQAEAMLKAVLEAGINYIDTSIDYGQSEELIGRYLSGRRSEYFLASKCGCLVGHVATSREDRPSHVFTAENVRAGIEQSLRRLQTGYLDLVQFHHSPSRFELEEFDAISVLQDFQRQGKIRFIGMSGTLPNLPEQIDMGVFDAFQIPYSAIQREHEDLITQVAAAGAGTVIRGGVARGAVSPEGARTTPSGMQKGAAQSVWEAAQLDDLLDGASSTEFVLRYTLSHPDLHTTIVGTANPDHLRANVEAAQKGALPNDVYEEATRRLTAAGSKPAE
jgi:aryl-alcohol dehydrogenase-like predicted oxidoreductase